MLKNYHVAKMGRAGLGNELFPYLRAAERAYIGGGEQLSTTWVKCHIGPWLRQETDKRQYWRLFKPNSARVWARRYQLQLVAAMRRGDTVIFIEKGMGEYFADFTLDSSWHRNTLIDRARPGVISPTRAHKYLSVHIRLGDFERLRLPTNCLDRANAATPIDWFVAGIRNCREKWPTTTVLISSDGSDVELEPVLSLPGVQRSRAWNALDEMMILAGSCGILGSRSTFTAWGAFLGGVPLMVMPGANAYRPHALVWEQTAGQMSTAWEAAVAEMMVAAQY